MIPARASAKSGGNGSSNGMIPDDRRESRATCGERSPEPAEGRSRTKPMDETFSKQERLIKTKDFRKVYRDGRSYKADFVPLDIPSNAVKTKFPTGFVILRLLPNALRTNRVGFSISAKSIKRAFRRNRIKRLFREAYRRNKKILKKGFDIVFVIRREAKADFSYDEAQKLFLDLSKRAGILL